jgi:hypothetical protein
MAEADRIFRRYLERPTRRRLAALVRAYHDFVWRVSLRITRNGTRMSPGVRIRMFDGVRGRGIARC